ncbi:MAG: murein biosynthesis integral membrane protein MurJ [Kiritimatiellae bacterium]|nr:murein biosynthesis integral membrane protein MurJ [Kiritimatiellia bacterium]
MQNRNVIRFAFTVGGFTMLSRILGMVRDVLTSSLFGTTLAFSAFTVAWRIPNLFRALFGEGALSAAFIPVFQETRQCQGEAAAWGLARRIMSLAGVVLLTIVGLGIIGLTIALHWPGDAIGDRTRTILPLVRIMLPYVFFICMGALAMGVLNTYRLFSISAFTPALLNITWILSVLFVIPVFRPPLRITVLAWTVFVAGAVQLLYLLPPLWRVGWRPRFERDWSNPLVRRVFLLMGPSALGLAVNQVDVLLSSWLAMAAAPWAPSTLYYAERLIYLPQGILATSLGVVLLPILSEYAAANRRTDMLDTVQHGLRTLLFVMTPAAIGLLVLAAPVVALLFQHGKFDALSTFHTARALRFYAPGLMVFCLAKVFVPAFYALQDTKTPVKVGLCTVAICFTCNVLSVLLLPEEWRHAGLAASTVIAECFNGLTLATLLCRRLGRLPFRAILGTLARALACAALMALAAYYVNGFLSTFIAGYYPRLASFSVLPAIVLAALVYLFAARLLRAPELGFVLEALHRKKSPAKVA